LNPRLVLVAEDDDILRETLSETLRLEGYLVAGASDGAEALMALERLHPNIVLPDITMPVLDGKAFKRELEARGLRVPILVMTAANNADSLAEEIDADGWVGKPFTLSELLPAIERLCA
jgi:two-component system, OmpR family, response regulator